MCKFGGLQLDGVGEVNANVAVRRLVANDVTVLRRRTGHHALPAEQWELHRPHVEEEPTLEKGEVGDTLAERATTPFPSALVLALRDDSPAEAIKILVQPFPAEPQLFKFNAYRRHVVSID